MAALAAGCLGTDHVFPDESDKVVAIHVNAYAKVGQDGVLELSGHDGGNVTRAFAGTVRFLLEEQHDPPSPPTYTKVKEWSVALKAPDFANPGNHPLHAEAVPRGTFPEAGTYRVLVDATVGGRHLPPEAALFYAEP
jgi:hypothetical protein